LKHTSLVAHGLLEPVFRIDLVVVVVSFKEINECDSNPCQNGGRCIDLVDNFTCVCVVPFTGQHCETGTLIP
uniref:EGF-like domain-containing protein n=1 Tax=Varanus komodoensis TaxID=61221 RepID=A0A8D2L3N7_VARKO